MKLKCSFFIVFSVWVHFVLSQNVTVLDAATNQPVQDVSIYNLKKNTSVITNSKGQAAINAFTNTETIYFHNLLFEDKQLTKPEIAKNSFIVYLLPKVEGLNQIVISASKFKQSKQDVPQNVVSITSKDITVNQPQTSADLLSQSGNVFVQKSQMGGGSPMIRGFSTNRLLITVDGVRMNNAIFRGGNLQNVISIDPFAINKTEVTLGAGAVVYGSDAIGGVMSFYTKRPQLSYKDSLYFKGNAILRYASANNENTAHVSTNFGYKKWAFLSSMSYTDFGDLRMGNNGSHDYLRHNYVTQINGEDVLVANPNPKLQQPTAYQQFNAMQKARYEVSDNLNFDFGLYFSTTSNNPRYDRLIRPEDNGLRSAEWYYGPQQWFMANAQLTKLSSSSNLYDKIHSVLAYQNFKESRVNRDFQSNLKYTNKEQVNAFSFNVDFEKQLTSKTSLFYGLEYLFNKVKSTATEKNIESNTTTTSVTRYPNGATWQSVAAYASLKHKPNVKFVLQSGLRYNQVFSNANFKANNAFLNLPFNEASVNTGALTATAGFTWLPNPMLQWKFNLSTAFRAPNIDDIGKVFDSEPGAVVVPNKNLKAEYAYGGELGLTLNFNKKTILSLATYYTFLDNALIRRNYTLNGESQIMYNGQLSQVQAIQNASKAWIYGFEAAIKLNLTKNLKLHSQYNIIGGTEANNGTEVPVRHVAPNFGQTQLIWQHNKLSLSTYLVYNNELSFNQLAPSEIAKDYLYALDESGNPYAPSWYTLNFRGQYQFNNSVTLTANLENITDQRYRSYSSGIAAAGRNLILALSYKF